MNGRKVRLQDTDRQIDGQKARIKEKHAALVAPFVTDGFKNCRLRDS